ncbi:MAG: S1C family serine protease [Nitrospinales bacterium]
MNQSLKNSMLWFFVLLLAGWAYQNWGWVDLMLSGTPRAEELSFNRPGKGVSPAVAFSSDEQINVDVFERVHEAVVNIAATTLTMNFWRQIVPEQGQGSGFIIDAKGYILTNNHVVENAQQITVTLGNGKKIDAILIGRDVSTDLAVIKIPQQDVTQVVALGDSDAVRVGQKAIAIGNPFGLSQTMTTGIISALNRQIQEKNGSTLYDLIQTDAAINPGNSGGPLLNSSGQVIGINTAIFSVSGGYQGIGFAIPVNRVKEVTTQLITKGRYARPWLGVSGLALSPNVARALGLGVREGIMIVEVAPGSPADLAGLRGGLREVVIGNLAIPTGGDVVLAVGRKKIVTMEELIKEINRHKVGDTLSFKIWRNNATFDVEVVLQEKPAG